MKGRKGKGAASVAIIGGADGPTSIFLAGKRPGWKGSLKNRLRDWKQDKRRERIRASAVPGSHTAQETAAWLMARFGAVQVPAEESEYREKRSCVKAALVLRERPDLVETPEPVHPKIDPGRMGKEEKEALETFFAQAEKRNREAAEVPEESFPMIYSMYRIRRKGKHGEKVAITVDFEEVRQLMGVSYNISYGKGRRRWKKRPDKPATVGEIYDYFGFSREDMETGSERFLSWLSEKAR